MNMSNNIKPRNFDVWLFAVDLVNLVFLKIYKHHSLSVVNFCPNFVCKEFSETLKKAVQLIQHSMKRDVDEAFANLQQRNSVTNQTYLKYARELRRVRLSQGFDAEKFLYYSVHVASLAYRFCNEGVRKAQISAVTSIADEFRDCSRNCGLWEVFDEIAEKIVSESTDTGSLLSCRSLARELASSMDYFSSPDFESKGVASRMKVNADSTGGSLTDSSKQEDFKDLSRPKRYASDVASNSRRLSKSKSREHPMRDYKPMPSVHEFLESSLEELSISSASPIKLVNGEESSNSTPEHSDITRKPVILKKRSSRDSLERQIFKHTPLRGNRIKTESGIYKEKNLK